MSDKRFEELFTKRPCIGCVFFGACGDLLRTNECKERMSKGEFMALVEEQNGEKENR